MAPLKSLLVIIGIYLLAGVATGCSGDFVVYGALLAGVAWGSAVLWKIHHP